MDRSLYGYMTRGADGAGAARVAGRYVVATLMVAGMTFALWLLQDRLTIANASLLFMLVTLIAAVWLGTGPSVLTAILSFFGFNFFLVQPYYTLAVQDPRELLDLVVFLAVALIGGRLAGYARQQAEAASLNAMEKNVLYGLTSALNPLTERSAVRDELRRVVKEDLGALEVSFLPDEPPAAGSAAGASPIFVLLQTGETIYGTLRAVFPQALTTSQDRLLTACAGQAALALQRIDLTEQAQKSRSLAEADRLKTALLRAVSHDLRTPLTIIKTSAANLDELHDRLTVEQERELVHTIESQADRLNELVGNLLDMSRLEAGAVVLHEEWNSLEEIAGEVAARSFETHKAERIILDFPDDLPLVRFDYRLMLQALGNIVENALRYEPDGRRVIIRGRVAGREARLEVINHGPTIPAAEKELVTEPFYQAAGARAVVGHVGLGLAIARGIVETHRGRLWVEDTSGGGATFVIILSREEDGP